MCMFVVLAFLYFCIGYWGYRAVRRAHDRTAQEEVRTLRQVEETQKIIDQSVECRRIERQALDRARRLNKQMEHDTEMLGGAK